MSVDLLDRALARQRHHLSPFLMLGDPDPDTSVELCRLAADSGATMLELGLPFATPSADGPTVQAAGARALARGVSTDRAFELLARIRAACPELPCNLLVYGNLVHARGLDRFCRDAARCGASTLLVPDIPLEEGDELRAACRQHRLGAAQLAGPRTPPARLQRIAAAADDAFVYLTGVQGVTGAADRNDDHSHVRDVVRHIDRPVCVGFGLQSRADVAATFAAGARIAVVGSHLIRGIERALLQSNDPRPDFAAAVRELLPTSPTPAN